MTKKAILVELNIRTRLIVDVPEGKNIDSEEMFEKIAPAEKVRQNFIEDSYYPYEDNIIEIEEDTDVPYGTLTEDKA